MPPGTADAEYLQQLDSALRRIQDSSPEFLVLSLGFDTAVVTLTLTSG